MAWKGERGTRHERGYGREYMRQRAIVMQVNADGRPTALCRECLEREGRPTPATDCDHIIPKHKADPMGMVYLGGDLIDVESIKNKQPLCRACHKAKTAREAVEASGGRVRPTIGVDGWPVE